MFRVGYRALFSSYSLVHKCACACILYTSVHANVLSLTTCSVDEGSVLEILQVGLGRECISLLFTFALGCDSVFHGNFR